MGAAGSPTSDRSNGDPGALRSRWGILGVLLVVHSLDSLVRFAMAPLGPLIMADLAIGRGAFGALSSALRISGISVAVASGRTVDRIGVRRSMFVVALVVPLVMSLFAVPLTYTVLFGLFLLAGASISLISPLGNAAIMRWFGPRERGLAFGIKQMGVPLGSAITALALPPIALLYGWQAAFVIVGIVVGLFAALSGFLYSDPLWAAASRRRAPSADAVFPPSDAMAATISDGSAAVGSTTAPEPEALPTAWEQFMLPGMPWLILMGLTFAAVQMCFLTFATPFLLDIGLDLVTAAAYLSLSQFAGMAGRPIVGIISDRWLNGRRKRILLVIATAIVGSIATMATFAATLSPVGLAIVIAAVGMSSMAWAGLFFASVLERADPRGLGSASGLASTANMSGSLLGAPLFGFIADFADFATAFLVFAGLLAAIATVFARKFSE